MVSAQCAAALSWQVGAEVARRAQGLGLTVIAHDPFASEERARALGVRLVPFDEALGTADFFSLHMPLTPGTKVTVPPRPSAALITGSEPQSGSFLVT